LAIPSIRCGGGITRPGKINNGTADKENYAANNIKEEIFKPITIHNSLVIPGKFSTRFQAVV